MTETEQTGAHEREAATPAELVRSVAEALEANDPALVRSLVADVENPDLADLIELLDPEQRVGLIQALGSDFDFEVLTEVDEKVRDQLSEALPNDVLARGVSDLESDDAAYLLESLEADDQKEILDQMPQGERAALQRNLHYPEETAGRLMQADFVAVPPFWTVEQVVDFARDTEDLPETFSEIFVVDPGFHLLGSVDLSRLLRSKRDVKVDTIMDTDRHIVLATADQEEVARQFERYGLMAAPVVDKNERLVGVVTVDDVVEVIGQEVEEDAKLLAGVGDERLERQRSRNCAAALLLAVRQPVHRHSRLRRHRAVRCDHRKHGGARRAHADRRLHGRQRRHANHDRHRARARHEGAQPGEHRARRHRARPPVGLINGLAFALIMSLVVFAWFGTEQLGLVIGSAMIINMLAAALAGIFIPLALDRMGFDPAVASTVFVTTVTDVVGFFSFLGLASLWLT